MVDPPPAIVKLLDGVIVPDEIDVTVRVVPDIYPEKTIPGLNNAFAKMFADTKH